MPQRSRIVLRKKGSRWIKDDRPLATSLTGRSKQRNLQQLELFDLTAEATEAPAGASRGVGPRPQLGSRETTKW